MRYRVSERITVTLARFKKRMAPSRQRNETTGGKNLNVSRDETKRRLPEERYSPIRSARSFDWAECRNKKVSAPSRRWNMSLDIPFYRTAPVRQPEKLGVHWVGVEGLTTRRWSAGLGHIYSESL